jgi:hypothetical protein
MRWGPRRQRRRPTRSRVTPNKCSSAVTGGADSRRRTPNAGVPPAFGSGWWNSTGFHSSGNKNYITGQLRPTQYHDFFVVDLSTADLPVLDATLNLFNPASGFSSDKPTETYTLFDVSTPIDQLRASGSGRTDIFDDLSTGVSFGSRIVSTADNGKVVNENLFGFTGLSSDTRQLVATLGNLADFYRLNLDDHAPLQVAVSLPSQGGGPCQTPAGRRPS